MKIMKKLISFILMLALTVMPVLLPCMFMTVSAEEALSGGDTISSGGEYVLEADTTGIIMLSTTEPVTITGDETGHANLRINCTVPGVDLSIQDLKITLSTYTYSAIAFTGAGNTLTLIGESDFSDTYSPTMNVSSAAVVSVRGGTELTITGDGKLTVLTRSHGAGIGSGYSQACGNITISGTTVYAYAESGGSAIGAGYVGTGGSIRIENSTVNAGTVYYSSAPFAAAIGGGSYGSNGGKIEIADSTVTAVSDEFGAAIGTAFGGYGTDIHIERSYIEAKSYRRGAAIGDGGGASKSGESKILIEDSTIIAENTLTGNNAGAAIGGGSFYSGYGNGSYPEITVKSSSVTATTAGGGAAIGSGNNGSGTAGTENNNLGKITIASGSTVYARSGNGAAIGGGYGYSGGTITIEGSNTDVTAISGDKSAGIGGAYYSAADNIVGGGTLTVKDMPSVKSYSNVSDGAIQGVEVDGVTGTNSKIVHGSLHETLADSVNDQTITVSGFLNGGGGNETYTLTLPKKYISFAVHTMGAASEGKYVSRILKNGGVYLLGNTDQTAPLYLYLLGANDIYRIAGLKLLGEVIFDLNYTPSESTPPAVQVVELNGLASEPENPARTGNTFDGWHKDKTGTDAWNFDSDEVVKSVTLYAKWEKESAPPPEYTVVYNSNGGRGLMASDTVESGNYKLKSNIFTKTDYIFAGWSTTPNGSVEYANGTTINITDNLTLYAIWNYIGGGENTGGGGTTSGTTTPSSATTGEPAATTQEPATEDESATEPVIDETTTTTTTEEKEEESTAVESETSETEGDIESETEPIINETTETAPAEPSGNSTTESPATTEQNPPLTETAEPMPEATASTTTVVLPAGIELFDDTVDIEWLEDNAVPLTNGWFAVELSDDLWEIFDGNGIPLGIFKLQEGENIEDVTSSFIELNLIPLGNVMTAVEEMTSETAAEPPKDSPSTGDGLYAVFGLFILTVAGAVIFKKKFAK